MERARSAPLRRGVRRAASLLASPPARVALLALALVQLVRLAGSLAPPHVYGKDFRQEYCLARALLDGSPLYEPLVEQARRYVGSDVAPLPSPSAHPPSVATLFVPLALLPYRAATAIWLLVNLALLGYALRLLTRALGWRVKPGAFALLTSGALLWPPMMSDLVHGQLTVALLVCIVGSWSALKAERATLAGLWLGLGAALKLLPLLLVPWLLLERRWRTVAVAAALFALLNLPPVLRLGPGLWPDYVLRVAPQVAAAYQDKMLNLSLYGLIVRHTVGYSFARPLVAAPTHLVVGLADAIVLLAALGLAAVYGGRSEHDTFDLGWSVLVVAMLLLSPVTWPMSCVLLLLPIAVFARGFLEHRAFAGRLGVTHLLVLVAVAVPAETLVSAAGALANIGARAPGAPLPGPAALVLSLPNFALLLAFGIVCRALVRTRAFRPPT